MAAQPQESIRHKLQPGKFEETLGKYNEITPDLLAMLKVMYPCNKQLEVQVEIDNERLMLPPGQRPSENATKQEIDFDTEAEKFPNNIKDAFEVWLKEVQGVSFDKWKDFTTFIIKASKVLEWKETVDYAEEQNKYQESKKKPKEIEDEKAE